MAKHPVIDADVCIACGTCQEICPETFQVNDTAGHAEVINPSGCPEETLREAMDSCPVQCIHWED
ncbi:MAG: ferredoxin [Pseudomonadota bacterium]